MSFNPKTPYDKDIKSAKWRERKYAEYKAALVKNPNIEKLKELYAPSSVDSFVLQYVQSKVHFMEWGATYKKWRQERELAWVQKATEALQQIQQKKLFDLQCMWLSNKVQLEGIEISFDFRMWESEIMNCPCIPPITEDEVDLYIQYLQSTNYDKDAGWGLDRWQDHRGIIEAYNTDNANRNFPDWYDFYNGRKGTGVYMTFPDVRGELEGFYLRLANEEWQQAHKSEIETQQQEFLEKHDPRPSIKLFDKEFLKWFVDTFEDKHTQECRQLDSYFRYEDHEFDWFNIRDLLQDSEEPIPVEAHYDWKQALRLAAEKFIRKKTKEAMPLAYEQYRMRTDMGIAFETTGKKSNKDMEEIRNQMKQRIIRGRVLNGEAADLEF